MACSKTTCHAIWLWNFISALEVNQLISRPLKLLYANFAVVYFSKNTKRIYRDGHRGGYVKLM